LLAKLKPELRKSLQHYQDMPTTRVKLIELATQLEAASGGPPRQREAGKAPDRAESRPAESSRSKETKPPYKGKGKAVDKGRPRPQSKPPASIADSKEKERLRDEKRCFLCKKQGHFARDCPSSGSASTPDKPKNPRTQ
jgi:hypothetical protein